jgi:hypothetical protein
LAQAQRRGALFAPPLQSLAQGNGGMLFAPPLQIFGEGAGG